MAIRVLLDHEVLEENILLVSLIMAAPGVHAIAYAYPKVLKILNNIILNSRELKFYRHLNEYNIFRRLFFLG